MKYALTENGNIKITDGKPTIIDDDGKEHAVDAIGATKKITDLSAEAAGYRKKAVDRKKALEVFGDLDHEKARTALATVDSMDDKHKVDLEELKKNINGVWEEKEQGWEKRKGELKADLYKEKVTSKFALSGVVKKTLLTPKIAALTFGGNFKSDGSATYDNGNPILSISNPGDPAPFDEALEILINAHPDKESIWKGSGAGGSGSQGSGSGGGLPTEKTSGEKISSGLAKLRA
jgi:hypothetical protein